LCQQVLQACVTADLIEIDRRRPMAYLTLAAFRDNFLRRADRYNGNTARFEERGIISVMTGMVGTSSPSSRLSGARGGALFA
jgi:hypothetical protein